MWLRLSSTYIKSLLVHLFVLSNVDMSEVLQGATMSGVRSIVNGVFALLVHIKHT